MIFNLLKSGLGKIKEAFSRTRSILGDKVRQLLNHPLDEQKLEELEQILYEADLGTLLAEDCVKHLENFSRKHPKSSSDELVEVLKDYLKKILAEMPLPPKEKEKKPRMILMVGVNGSGKTTSCAKLAYLFKKEGKKVLLAAGDTFRAGAIHQLDLWSKRLNLDCIKGKERADPSSVIFDGLNAAMNRDMDLVIADTAGRLQSKTHLMDELAKILRVIKKLLPEGPDEIYLVLDATTGQNAIDQAKIFNQFTPLTGIILTKLDGSAKGGIILSIFHQMKIPIRYIGIGEKENDFIAFDPKSYIEALF